MHRVNYATSLCDVINFFPEFPFKTFSYCLSIMMYLLHEHGEHTEWSKAQLKNDFAQFKHC